LSNAGVIPDFHRFRAAIFDLDGTLVHSEHAWEAAKLDVLGQYGFNPSPELLNAHIGRGLSGFLDEAFDRPLSAKKHNEVGNKIGRKADDLLPSMRHPVPGAAKLLCDLHDAGLRIAICSSSPRRHIVSAANWLGIADRIEIIVSGAELLRGKPDPLPYITTLEALDLQPELVCAFEDSVAGATSASAADLTVLAIGAGCTRSIFDHCEFRAEDFRELVPSGFG
jgi:HAD superfamily hydrolase (TIGR01509 family)